MQIIKIEAATPRELRQFGLVFSMLVAIAFGAVLPWWLEYTMPLWPFAVAVPVVGAALLKPAWLSALYVTWMTFGHYIGWLNTRLVLLVMFCVVMLPAGLIFRLASRRDGKPTRTYRQPKEKRDPTHMEHPY